MLCLFLQISWLESHQSFISRMYVIKPTSTLKFGCQYLKVGMMSQRKPPKLLNLSIYSGRVLVSQHLICDQICKIVIP